MKEQAIPFLFLASYLLETCLVSYLTIILNVSRPLNEYLSGTHLDCVKCYHYSITMPSQGIIDVSQCPHGK